MIIETLIGVGTFAGGMATYAFWNSSGYKKGYTSTQKIDGLDSFGKERQLGSKNKLSAWSVPIRELSQKEQYAIEEVRKFSNTPEQLQEAEEKWKKIKNKQTKTLGELLIDVFTITNHYNKEELPSIISDDGDKDNTYYYVYVYVNGKWDELYWKDEVPKRKEINSLLQEKADKKAEQRIEQEEKERKAKEEQQMWEYIKNPQKEQESSSPYDSEGYLDIDYESEKEGTEQEEEPTTITEQLTCDRINDGTYTVSIMYPHLLIIETDKALEYGIANKIRKVMYGDDLKVGELEDKVVSILEISGYSVEVKMRRNLGITFNQAREELGLSNPEEEIGQELPTVEQQTIQEIDKISNDADEFMHLLNAAYSRSNGNYHTEPPIPYKVWNPIDDPSHTVLEVRYPYHLTFDHGGGNIDYNTHRKLNRMTHGSRKPTKENLRKAIEYVLEDAGYTLKNKETTIKEEQ